MAKAPRSCATAQKGEAVDAAGADPGEIVRVGIDEPRRLCGRAWDWIEAIGPG